MATYYITTAIDYVNAPRAHVGHCYEKVLADVVARWHRSKGEKVHFLTGTDENAQKNEQAAKEAGVPIQTFVDRNSASFRKFCDRLNISYDDFIRTTEERHVKVAQAIFQKLHDQGDIYKGLYKGFYCAGCEAHVSEKDLVDGKCPEHQKEPEWIEEENYFFKMSKYQDEVLALLKNNDFVIPESKQKEMISRIEQEGMKDLCATRYKASWGVAVPFDKDFKIYVWFDAILNYISALGYPDGKLFKTFWQGKVIHTIGKGINWFHSVIFPSVLAALKEKQPDTIWVHGYLTVNGQKISKSLGTGIDPVALAEKYGTDALRYFLIREIPFSVDGDFSEEALKNRLNNELANDLGNLVSRSLALVEKYFEGKVLEGKNELSFTLKKIEQYIEQYELHHALEEIWKFVKEVNKYINDKKPWEVKDKATILYTVLDSLRILAIVLSPFIPETATRINEQLGVKEGKLAEAKPNLLKAGGKIKKGTLLFKKHD